MSATGMGYSTSFRCADCLVGWDVAEGVTCWSCGKVGRLGSVKAYLDGGSARQLIRLGR